VRRVEREWETEVSILNSRLVLSAYLSTVAVALALCARAGSGDAATVTVGWFATAAALAPAGVLRRQARRPRRARIGGRCAVGRLSTSASRGSGGDDSTVSAFDLGYALAQSGRFEDSAAAFELALTDDPADADAHFHLGVALTELGRHAEAAEALRRATELRPLDVTAHHRLGLVLAAIGRRDEAIVALGEAIRLDPGMAEAHRALDEALRAARRTMPAAEPATRHRAERDRSPARAPARPRPATARRAL
jgi:tetratricopeptide (TPR) repeat protein